MKQHGKISYKIQNSITVEIFKFQIFLFELPLNLPYFGFNLKFDDNIVCIKNDDQGEYFPIPNQPSSFQKIQRRRGSPLKLFIKSFHR